MKKFGSLTVAQWLVTDIPEHVKAFIEFEGRARPLYKTHYQNGRLTARITQAGRMAPISPTTTVILSTGQQLRGAPWTALKAQARRINPRCTALRGDYLERLSAY